MNKIALFLLAVLVIVSTFAPGRTSFLVKAQNATAVEEEDPGLPSYLLEGALNGDIDMIEKAIEDGEDIDTTNGKNVV
jgi:hypothetical protein